MERGRNMTFRFATEADCPRILDFIRGLAEYEKMTDQVVATEELLREWIFDKQKAEVLFACDEGREVGFALFFHHFLSRQEAENAEAVAHVDADDAVPGIALAAVILIPGLPSLQRAAVDVDGHRRLLHAARRLPNVEIKAVLRIGLAVIVIQRNPVVMVPNDLCQRIVDRQVLHLHRHRRKGNVSSRAYQENV